jgi:hypothetical protein
MKSFIKEPSPDLPSALLTFSSVLPPSEENQDGPTGLQNLAPVLVLSSLKNCENKCIFFKNHQSWVLCEHKMD